MRQRPGRPAGILLALLIAIVPAARGAESDAPELIERGRAELARGQHKALERLIASNRIAAYEAVDLLLLNEATAADPLVDALAASYESVTGDGCLRARAAVIRGWSADQRRRHAEAITQREKAREALEQGRLAEARKAGEETFLVFQELGDLRMIGRSLAGFAGLAALEGDAPKALNLLDQADEVQRRSGDMRLSAQIAQNRSYIYVELLGDQEKARQILEAALPLVRRMGEVRYQADFLMNLAATVQGPDQARGRAWLEEAMTIVRASRDVVLEAAVWRAIANLDDRTGRIDDCEAAWRKALALSRKGADPLGQVQALQSLVEIVRRRFALKEARALLREAAAVSATMDNPIIRDEQLFMEAVLANDEMRPREAIRILDDLLSRADESAHSEHVGKLHSEYARALLDLGEYEKSAARLRRAIEHAAGAGRPDISAAYHSHLGSLLFDMGEWQEAVKELDAAAADYAASGRTEGPAALLEAAGQMRLRSGDLTGAGDALQESARLYDQPRTQLERTYVLRDLAELELARQPPRHEAARAWLAQARAIGTAIEDDDGLVLTGLLETHAWLAAGDVASARAALRRAEERFDPRGLADLDWKVDLARGRVAEAGGDSGAAIAAYRRSIGHVERIRQASRRVTSRAAILEQRVEPFLALSDLHRRAGDLHEAWRWARAARARTFLESLDPPRAEWTDDVVTARRREHDPDRPAEPVAPTPRLLAALADDEVLIDTYAEGDRLVMFVARRDGVTLHAIALPASALDAARRPGLPGPAGEAATAAWSQAVARLGAALLGPLSSRLAGVETILIVPGGALHGLPLGALTWEGRPLAARFAVATLPAADLILSRSRAPRDPAQSGRTLAMGDPATAEELSPLPASASEARAVAGLRATGGDARLGAEAKESILKRLGPQFDRIHLAAHGRLDRLAPQRSFIALAAGDGDDGRLEASEIARLRLTASVVILSGCEMGREEGLARGQTAVEERYGLARAFLSAGAGTVVASLWEMEDRSAGAIMTALHERLAGRGVPQALAQLQRDLIDGTVRSPSGESLAHPFYWAGLAAFGAGSSSEASSSSRAALATSR